jgi:predicted RNase H-like nuclease
VINDSKLDPIDEQLTPLVQAIGRAVLGAAALEKILLVDFLHIYGRKHGLRGELEQELSELERKPAGKLLERLRGLGLENDLAARIESVIHRRNELIHHFMEDPDVLSAFQTGDGVGRLVDRVNALAIDCQQIINEISPHAFSGLQELLGGTLSKLLDVLQSADLHEVSDPKLRTQLQGLRTVDPAELAEALAEFTQPEMHEKLTVCAGGVDGCSAGWVVALAFGEPHRIARTELRLLADIDALVAWHDADHEPVVAIDVPIGLPPEVGLRACDRQARERLGRRWMCVFEPPDRGLFGHDFDSARAVVHARRQAEPGKEFHVLTQQGIGIMGKIADVDRIASSDRATERWLIEVHPEVSFRELADDVELPRKSSSGGKKARLALLRPVFPDIEQQLSAASWPLVAGVEAPLSLVDRALLSSARLARCDAFNAGMSISTLEWSVGS